MASTKQIKCDCWQFINSKQIEKFLNLGYCKQINQQNLYLFLGKNQKFSIMKNSNRIKMYQIWVKTYKIQNEKY